MTTLDQARAAAPSLPLRQAAELFCFALNTTVAEVASKQRGEVTPKRNAVFHELYAVRRWSYPQIAAVFGTGHATVRDGDKRHKAKGAE